MENDNKLTMIKQKLYLILFLLIFSLFIFPDISHAQSTFWNFERDQTVANLNSLNLYLTISGAAQPKVLTVLPNGNVGIGTTAPTALLTVGGNSGQMDIAHNAGFFDPTYSHLRFLYNSSEVMKSYMDGNWSTVFNTGNSPGTGHLVFLPKGNVGIGTSSPNAKLEVRGNASVSGGALWANDHANLAAGALNIGNYTTNFGGGSGWTTNTAGLMLETLDNTEIAVHDAGTRAASLMYYQGGATNSITIGRNMGWDAVSSIILNGNVSITGTFSPTNMAIPGTFTATNGGYNINSAGTSRFLELKSKNWSTAGGASMCFGSAGELLAGNNIYTIGACSSDKRLKTNIRYFDTPMLDDVLRLRPAKFDLKDGTRQNITGFIAQDVQEIFPETVIDHGGDEMLQFSPENLVPQLTKAIQELSAKVDAQQKEIELLKHSQSR
jgi:hypothetical protein